MKIEFDFAATMNNLNNDQEMMNAIAEIVIADLPPLVSNLREAAVVGDRKKVRHAAHTIKGLAGNFRAQPLVSLAAKLEAEFESLSENELIALVDEADSTTVATIQSLGKELNIAVAEQST
jgi:HPt (histidine-containing phosphotransfer) domain-containing protein